MGISELWFIIKHFTSIPAACQEKTVLLESKLEAGLQKQEIDSIHETSILDSLIFFCFLNFLLVCVLMTTYEIHTAKHLGNTNIQHWMKQRLLGTNEKQLMANQNECITDLRKDRKASRHQPSEKVQETHRGDFPWFMLFKQGHLLSQVGWRGLDSEMTWLQNLRSTMKELPSVGWAHLSTSIHL